ncbi:MAG: hypothetical protein JNL38_15220 [Myxococcales bacterium]|nr:hypothetical protein [Myxococcales bacterium]
MRQLGTWAIAGFVGVIGVACAGASGSDLLDAPGSSSGASGGASSGATSSGTSGATSSGSSSSGASSSGASSSGASSSASSSGASSGDAGTPAKIKCGATSCKPGVEICCRKPGIPNPEYGCTAPNACNGTNALAIPCDDAADCAAAGQTGTVCCARTISAIDSRVNKITCEKPSNCVGDQSAIVCDPSLPSTGQCAATLSCKASVVSLPDYNLCLR